MGEPQSPIPHNGWIWLGAYDLVEPSHICNYCMHERIRYVHKLWHPQHPVIYVGCDCAERLIGNGDKPSAEEKLLRHRAKRFETWMKSDKWTHTPVRHFRPGKQYHHHYVIAVYQENNRWQWMLRVGENWYPSDNTFPTADAAMRQFWFKWIEKAEDSQPQDLQQAKSTS